MSVCNSPGGPAALDFPEVLKSLLEYSLPWTNKMTGRTEGTLRGLVFSPLIAMREAGRSLFTANFSRVCCLTK